MGQKERDLINQMLLHLDENERLFRINAGMAWTGEVAKKTENMIILKNPRPFHGAPNGWPDLCGWETKIVTLDMVGTKVAVFVGEEVKATGSLSKAQKKFRDIIERMGGIYRVLRDFV